MSSLFRIPLTGPTQERAAEQVQGLLDAIQTAGPDGLPSVVEAAWRASRGQSRWIVAGRSVGELTNSLAEFALDGSCVASGIHRGGPRRVTFVFSGMGPQWAGMGRTLANELPAFERHIQAVDRELAEHYGRSVWDDLTVHDEDETLPTALAQPANFLIQAALHDLMAEEGIVPDAVLGHSAGEVASAYAAGVYDRAEAAQVAVVRGRLQATLAGRGAMIAVGMNEEEAGELLADFDEVSLAAVNDHDAVTLAGDADQVAAIADRMAHEQIFAKVLTVEVPYHSPVMDEIGDELKAEMQFIEPKPAKLPFYSTVSGERSTGAEWGAEYWPINVRQPVRFAKAIEATLDEGSLCFIEFAPHPVLSRSIEALAPRDEGIVVVPLLSRRADEYETFSSALSELALESIGRPAPGLSATLPKPERQPQELWDQDPWYEADRQITLAAPDLTLLGTRVPDHDDEFVVELSLSDQPWIAGHEAEGLGPVVPATLWAEIMSLAATAGDQQSITLTDLTIAQGLPIFANPTIIRTRVAGGAVTCRSRPVGDTSSWTLNAVAAVGAPAPEATEPAADFNPPAGPGLDTDALYALFRLKGLHYSGAFNNLTNVTLDAPSAPNSPADEASGVAWATVDSDVAFVGGHHAPWVLDAGLQLLIAAARDLGEAMYLPYRLGRVGLHRPIVDGVCHLRAEVTARSESELVGTIRFFDDDGLLLAELADVVCLRNQSDDIGRHGYVDRNSYALAPLTAEEILDRFTADDEEFDLDDLEIDDLDPFDLDEPMIDLVDPDGNFEELEAADLARQYWLNWGDTRPIPGLDRPIVEIGSVPNDEHVHLLWLVPNSSRTDDAIATFELVNQVGELVNQAGMLDGQTITLSLIGCRSQHWLNGLRRAATNGLDFTVRTILVDKLTPTAELADWIDAIDEREVVLAGEPRLNRLERLHTSELQATVVDPDAEHLATVFDLPTIGPVQLGVEAVRPPGPGEVTIENLAVPLTWKDVGKVTGAIGASATSTFAGQHLGLGALGRVVAVGEHVPFKVGDVVAGAVRRPFRSRMTLNVQDEYMLLLPDGADPIDQLTLMMPWVTALAAIDDIGRVASGDRVFVQSGAGALGSVLCQHALSLGCSVVTSVGTEEKVDAVRAHLGAEVEVVIARGDAIAGTLIAEGYDDFDCVLATVSGAARSLLFSLLRQRGRYVDLGKPGGPDEVQLAAAVDGNRSLTRVDTDQIALADPTWFQDLIDRALVKVSDPANHTPITRFPVTELTDAILALARGTTVGSLVVEMSEQPVDTVAQRSAPTLNPDGAYVITGGYGAVGLMAAQWMVSRGAKTIVLTGRSGRAPEASVGSIEMLRAFGADIRVVAADVADPESTATLLRDLHQQGPIRGVVHAAGVVADGPFVEIDGDRVRRSFGAKVDGADNLVAGLDELDAWSDLDFFLLTSSMSGAVGVSIQGTYAAANTGLDGLAGDLRARGIHACAMQLGPIAEAGMAADDRNSRFFMASGLSMVQPRNLYGIFDLAASTNAAVLLTAEVDWQRVGTTEPGNASSSVLGHLIAEASAGGDQAGLEQLLMLSEDDRTEVLTLTLVGLFADALGLEPDALGPEEAFANMGIDSLAVVEIQAGIHDALQHEVPLARLFLPDGHIGQLAARISEYLNDVVVEPADVVESPDAIELTEPTDVSDAVEEDQLSVETLTEQQEVLA